MGLRTFILAIATVPLLAGCGHSGEHADSVAQDTPASAPFPQVEQDDRGTIQGRWLLVSGRDTVVLEFDTITMALTIDGGTSIPFRLDDDSLTVFERHHDELSTGRIRKLTGTELLVKWTTGDSNIYRRP